MAQATDESIALLPLVQQQKIDVAVASAAAGTSDSLANRATPAVGAGTFFFASDQAVLYFSTGSSWVRVGLPAGATTHWYSASAPTGWVAYDGTNLSASTGIYADLFAHLGGLTTPDTRGRAVVLVGTNTDVSTLGNSDGLAVGSRSPKHNATNSLTLPNHAHSVTDPGHAHNIADNLNVAGADQGVNINGATTNSPLSGMIVSNTTGITVGNPTTNPAIGGSIGPGGSRPTDTSAFITFGLLIAKL